jgi:hypothetical protein
MATTFIVNENDELTYFDADTPAAAKQLIEETTPQLQNPRNTFGWERVGQWNVMTVKSAKGAVVHTVSLTRNRRRNAI